MATITAQEAINKLQVGSSLSVSESKVLNAYILKLESILTNINGLVDYYETCKQSALDAKMPRLGSSPRVKDAWIAAQDAKVEHAKGALEALESLLQGVN